MELRKTWLEDKDGNKVSPNTLSSQVYNGDGTRLEDTLNLIQYYKNKVGVHFGDSIIDLFTIPSDIATKLKCNITNVGMQATCITPTDLGSTQEGKNWFSLLELTKSLVSNNWSNQESASRYTTYKNHLDLLKAINWSNVDFCILSYGTNDFGGQVALGDTRSIFDEESVCACLRKGISNLLSLNPNMEIIVTTPIYRRFSASDSKVVSYSTKYIELESYRNAIALVSKEMGCKVVDLYACSDINENNESQFLSDGLHPNSQGVELWVNAFCNSVKSGYCGAVDMNSSFHFEGDNICEDSEELTQHLQYNATYVLNGIKYLTSRRIQQYGLTILGFKRYLTLTKGTILKFVGIANRTGDTNHRVGFKIYNSSRDTVLLDKYSTKITGNEIDFEYSFTLTEDYEDVWIMPYVNNMSVPSTSRALVRKCSFTVSEEKSSGGTTVIANPTMEGTESDLDGIQIGDEKFKIPSSTTIPSVTYEEYMNNLDLYKDKIVGIEDKDGVAVANLVDYDNTESGLEATNVQEAIDELANKQPSPSGDVAITDLVNWESVTTETLGGVDYKVMWQIAPTADNDVYGLAISSNGLLAYIRSNKGAKSTGLTTYSQNTCSQMYNGSSASGAVKYPTMSNYELIPNSYTMINFFNGNTYKGLVKINCNGKGAVPLYLNGEITSATNYEIPKGSYMMFYDGTNYYLRTDGKMPVEPEKFGGMTIQELQLGFIQYVNYAPNLKVEVEESTKEIQPRVFYNFTNPINGDLTITFGEFPSDPRLPQQNFANEYTFGFVAGTNCNLILPSDVKWLNRVPSLDQGNYYEVSVLNNRAVISIGVEA